MTPEVKHPMQVRGKSGLEGKVEARFGVLPNFFRLTPANPEITENLWGFAQFAYLDNPLPSLFKERLFVYLSRFCEVRYCIARHVGFLVGLGRPSADSACAVQTPEQVVSLLQRPFARDQELAALYAICETCEKPLRDLPQADSDIENAVFACASHVFLQTADAPTCLEVLTALFGERLEHLILFLAFVRMAHYWTRVHPGLSFEPDVEHLLATHEALAECILNDPEASVDVAGKRILEELPALRQEVQEATTLLAAIVSSSDDAIVSLHLDGTIKAWNKGAEQLFGFTDQEAIGRHINLIVPEDRRAEESDILSRLARGEWINHLETVRRSKDGSLLDVALTILPIRDSMGRIVGASKTSRDITGRNKSAEQVRKADEGLRLMRAQDQERRHIARELHDTAGQTLAVLSMSLGQLMTKVGQALPDLSEEGEQVRELVFQLEREIRTTSYLLHPPLLDESGLASALTMYVDGLKKRGALDVTLSILDDFGRLSPDMELAIFRVVQECLTNVHRHSGSRTAAIQILRGDGTVYVEVRDDGKGISAQRLAEITSRAVGVGLRGISERLAQFKGEMKIQSNGSGTTISASLPLIEQHETSKSRGAAI